MSSINVIDGQKTDYKPKSKFSLRPLDDGNKATRDGNVDYILQLKALSDRHQMRWVYSSSSTKNSERIGLIQLRNDGSLLTESVKTLSNTSSPAPRDRKRQKFDHGSSTSNSRDLHSEDDLGRVTQLSWSNENGLIFAGFSDSPSLLAWDLRLSSAQPVHKLKGSNSGTFLCCDQSQDGNLVLGGLSNQDSNQDQVVEVFDLRKPEGSILRYDQSHSDQISRVKFLKRRADEYERGEKDLICSGSLDGLMVTYDLNFQDEDDSVISICNIGASVAHLQPVNDYHSIWLGTDMETLAVWQTDKSNLIDHGDIRKEKLSKPDPHLNLPASYLIDCVDLSSSISFPKSRSAYFAGNQAGEVVLVDTSDEVNGSWNLLGSLRGGHEDMIRCAEIDRYAQLIGTGGEDGRVCFWSL